jgi:hypothetical protein
MAKGVLVEHFSAWIVLVMCGVDGAIQMGVQTPMTRWLAA